MQRLQFVLFGLYEAKRYIVDGRLPGLRAALILLDNAIEVTLDSWIEMDIAFDDMFEKILKSARELGIPDSHPEYFEIYKQTFIKSNEKKKVNRFFDEKIRYVTDIKKKITPSIGKVISHLHRYRNDAHHAARIRTDTILTSAVILLELCCQLIELLKVSTVYSSSEDYTWLEGSFNIKAHDLWSDEGMAEVLSQIRTGVSLSEIDQRNVLAENLRSRLKDLISNLDYISENTRIALDRAAALIASQKFILSEINNTVPYYGVPPDLDKPASLDQLELIKLVPERILAASNSVLAFEIYASADNMLDRLEFMVNRFVDAIDRAIQLEIDIARGK